MRPSVSSPKVDDAFLILQSPDELGELLADYVPGAMAPLATDTLPNLGFEGVGAATAAVQSNEQAASAPNSLMAIMQALQASGMSAPVAAMQEAAGVGESGGGGGLDKTGETGNGLPAHTAALTHGAASQPSHRTHRVPQEETLMTTDSNIFQLHQSNVTRAAQRILASLPTSQALPNSSTAMHLYESGLDTKGEPLSPQKPTCDLDLDMDGVPDIAPCL